MRRTRGAFGVLRSKSATRWHISTAEREWIHWVREGGVEPPHPYGHTDLNRARLPIPPLARRPVARALEGYNQRRNCPKAAFAP